MYRDSLGQKQSEQDEQKERIIDMDEKKLKFYEDLRAKAKAWTASSPPYPRATRKRTVTPICRPMPGKATLSRWPAARIVLLVGAFQAVPEGAGGCRMVRRPVEAAALLWEVDGWGGGNAVRP